jgi:hypothetical protein
MHDTEIDGLKKLLGVVNAMAQKALFPEDKCKLSKEERVVELVPTDRWLRVLRAPCWGSGCG